MSSGGLGPWAWLAVVVLSACGSEFESADTGPTDGGGGSVKDAGSDAAGGSAGSSAGTSGSAGAPSCAADFCASFDDVPTPSAGWDVSEVVGTGSLELLFDEKAPSAPNVLHASVGAGEPTTQSYHAARLSLQPSSAAWATSTPRLELSFVFSVLSADPKTALASIANYRYGRDEHYLVVALAPPNGGTQRIIAYPAPAETPVIELGTIKVGQWQSVRMIVPKRSGAADTPVGSGATVELDGVAKTLTLTPAVLTPDLRFDLGLGIPNAAGGSFAVLYDDVAITYSAEP